MNTVVLPDGKISLPVELRESLGLTPGTVLEVQSEFGKIVAWKKTKQQAFEEARPFTFSLPSGPVTADLVWASLEDEDE